jgi:hypothetical protein
VFNDNELKWRKDRNNPKISRNDTERKHTLSAGFRSSRFGRRWSRSCSMLPIGAGNLAPWRPSFNHISDSLAWHGCACRSIEMSQKGRVVALGDYRQSGKPAPCIATLAFVTKPTPTRRSPCIYIATWMLNVYNTETQVIRHIVKARPETTGLRTRSAKYLTVREHPRDEHRNPPWPP